VEVSILPVYYSPLIQFELPQELTNSSSKLNLPVFFDSRNSWPYCKQLFRILDQGECGSCWAFGAVESFSDRFCIATNGSFNIELSEQQMVSCNLDGNEACGGGDPITAFRYIAEWGLPTSACVPYVSGDGDVPSCYSACTNNQNFTLFYADILTLRWHLTIDGIMTSIMTNGPVEACFEVYEDFFSYSSGVYVHETGSYVGGHCIILIGWGVTTDGTEYWVAQNSWGQDWGLNGRFWIKKGVDECGIEWQTFSILPSLPQRN